MGVRTLICEVLGLIMTCMYISANLLHLFSNPADIFSADPSYGDDALYGAITAALIYNVYSERVAMSKAQKEDQSGPKQ